jgi:ABC-2 type transport system ATP-binding protein
MDEAERCHKLAYIAQGKLLITGTIKEVIASQQLVAWEVSGDGGLQALAEQLRALPAVEQVTAFGSRLHIIGNDAAALDAALQPFRQQAGFQWEKIDAGLEDVFISLMERNIRQQEAA